MYLETLKHHTQPLKILFVLLACGFWSSKVLASSDIYCPVGTTFNKMYKLCMNSTEALGPFTQGMIKQCKMVKPKDYCEGGIWDITTAGLLRGTGICPRGSYFDYDIEGCTEGDLTNVAFGPFKMDQVRLCKKNGWGIKCDLMRWPLKILRGEVNPNPEKQIPKPGTTPRGIQAKLYSYYSNYSNYQKVTSDVMKWYGTRSNGCVAFMSSALRQVGLSIPKTTDSRGENISLVTRPFSNYLEYDLGWIRITDDRQMKKGDIVFTEDAKGWPGYPAHTYMFAGWKNYDKSSGFVIDNQDFTHTRNIYGYAAGNFTPFAYALRAP
jgi:hypothetical protein